MISFLLNLSRGCCWLMPLPDLVMQQLPDVFVAVGEHRLLCWLLSLWLCPLNLLASPMWFKWKKGSCTSREDARGPSLDEITNPVSWNSMMCCYGNKESGCSGVHGYPSLSLTRTKQHRLVMMLSLPTQSRNEILLHLVKSSKFTFTSYFFTILYYIHTGSGKDTSE